MPNLNNLVQYCENSSLAGVAYIVSGFTMAHKLFWLAMVSILTAIPLYVSYDALRTWNEFPTKKYVQTVPITDMTFPAVTVCSRNTPWMAYQDILNRVPAEPDVLHQFNRTMGRMYKLRMLNFYKTFNYSQSTNFRNIMENTDCPECNEVTWGKEHSKWLYLANKIYRDDCNSNGSYCGFYNAVILRLRNLDQDSEFKNWQLKVSNTLGNSSSNPKDSSWMSSTFLFEMFTACYTGLMGTDDMVKDHNEITTHFLGSLTVNKFKTLDCNWTHLALKLRQEKDDFELFPNISEKSEEMRTIKLHQGVNLLLEKIKTPCRKLSSRTESLNLALKPIRQELNLATILAPSEASNLLRLEDIVQLSCQVLKLNTEKNLCYTPLDDKGDGQPLQEEIKASPEPTQGVLAFIRPPPRGKHPPGGPPPLGHLPPPPPRPTEAPQQLTASQEVDRLLNKIQEAQQIYGLALTAGESRIELSEIFCPKNLTPAFTVSVMASRMKDLAILNAYRTLTRPRITRLGQTLAWFIRNHVMLDEELFTDEAYATEGIVDEPKINKEIRIEMDLMGENISKTLLTSVKPEWSSFDPLFNSINTLSIPMRLFTEAMTFPKRNCYHDYAHLFISKSKETDNHYFSRQLDVRLPDFRYLSIAQFENISFADYCQDASSDNMVSKLHCICNLAKIFRPKLEEIFSIMKNAFGPSSYSSNHLETSQLLGRSITDAVEDNQESYFMPPTVPLCLYGDKANWKDFDDPDISNFENIQKNLCRDFYLRPSDNGMCHTFNQKPLSAILKSSKWLTSFYRYFTQENENEKENVRNVEGPFKGLAIAVDTLQNINVSQEKWYGELLQIDPNRFIVKVHSSNDLARVHYTDFLSSYLFGRGEVKDVVHSYQMELNADVFAATKVFKTIDISKRQCLFSDENKSNLFKIYTQSNCEMECQWKKAYEVCGCKPWYVPAEDHEKVCYYLGNICFSWTMEQLGKNAIYTECLCLPNCEETRYYTHVRPMPDTYRVVVDDSLGDPSYDLELMTVYATDDQFQKKRLVLEKTLSSYIMESTQKFYHQDPFLAELMEATLRPHPSELKSRQGNFFHIFVSFINYKSTVQTFVKDQIMSLPDKISWIGGTIGAFNGFCLMSLIEIVYWLLMIVFGNSRIKIRPRTSTIKPSQKCHERYQKLKDKLERIKRKWDIKEARLKLEEQ